MTADTFPDRELDAEQQRQRAEAILAHMCDSIDAWGGLEALNDDAQRAVVRIWNWCQTDLMSLKGMAL